MKRLPLVSLALLSSAVSAPIAAQEPALVDQLAAAVLPLPTPLRAEAGVLRWTGPGQTEELRPSGNGMSCSVDDPSDDQFDVRCYHDEFWVAIRRVRELRSSLGSAAAMEEQLLHEVSNGLLQMPSAPTAGYRMLGPISAYDAERNETGPEIRKWQSIHFPFETAEAMGLPEAREPNDPALPGLMPFVMASGTWWSHVMIVHEPFR